MIAPPLLDMNYWLIKSEGTCYSIDDLAKDGTAPWTGIRNFQARNYMRDGMKRGDRVLFYHSMSEPTGVYGVAEVASAPHIDESALDPKDEHYDAAVAKKYKAGELDLGTSGWVCVDMKFIQRFAHPVALADMKKDAALAHMLVLKKGQRLSVLPVKEDEYKRILEMVRE